MNITNGRELDAALATITNAMTNSSAPGQRAGNRAVELMQAKMQGPKNGILYGSHRASAPGEAPAIETGSIHDGFRVESSGATTNVYNDSDHWMHMEYGTIHIAPRPFIATTLEESSNEIARVYADELAAIVESMGSEGSPIGSGRVAQGGSGGSRSTPQVPRRVASVRNVLK